MYLHSEIMICQDCLFAHANGDMPHMSEAEIKAWEDKIERLRPEGAHLAVTSTEETDEEFTFSACGSCGSTAGGSRHGAVYLCQHEDCAPGDSLAFAEALTPDVVAECSGQGDVTEAVRHWARQLGHLFARISAEDIRRELRESGGWTDDELDDDAVNRERYLWLACDRKEREHEDARE